MQIRKIRKQLGLSQTQLAKLVGIKQGTISMYESGANFPSLPVLRKMAQVLNCTTDELLGIDHANK